MNESNFQRGMTKKTQDKHKGIRLVILDEMSLSRYHDFHILNNFIRALTGKIFPLLVYFLFCLVTFVSFLLSVVPISLLHRRQLVRYLCPGINSTVP